MNDLCAACSCEATSGRVNMKHELQLLLAIRFRGVLTSRSRREDIMVKS